MTNEEAQKVLDEFQGVRPEALNEEAKRLFEAIMKIADNRDELYEKVQKQDKIIDLMANSIATNDSNLCQYLDITTKCKYYAGENKKLCDDCIKEYFENKAKEVE